MSPDDTRRILDLLAQGKITVDEADQLLNALRGAPGPAAADPRADQPLRYIKIAVRKHRGESGGRQVYSWPGFGAESCGSKEVNIRVPYALVRSGMRLGAILPGRGDWIAQALRDKGIDADLSKIDAARLESLLKEMGEITVDVDHGRAEVRISAE